MKKILLPIALAAATTFAAPASATELVENASGVSFSAFDSSTRGTLLGYIESDTSPAFTYSGIMRSAVYQNTLGTLDFYFQIAISSIDVGDEVFNLTGSNFMGYTIDALFDATDFDGAGGFEAAFNPNLDPNGPAGSTTTASRSGSGSIIRADFGSNGLEAAGQTSATYIFRTNATNYNLGGTFTAQDGSVAQRLNFSPTAAPAVPEPGTWAMMLLGFGAIGFGLRRRRHPMGSAMQIA
ncbi:PEP-CTERM sorting domain-containing protein [Sphingomonas rhizophila]|uniref:PEP-CTERM sorting domain-containing protein n=1 Tax=Sphingomonas rhizophila TaxID=2071607 RepID=A0A7G9S9S5_9SPHN|nr:PEPxxWA-CTERM sorting domain-containing protein [Sphingomonas rhizophila]QNN64600.1 PEP-CTERM sorting domain-containing protein [Sphingomonas rhizophila]